MKCFPFVSAYLLVPVLALPAFAADRTEEVRATEVAFAKAFAERDAKKFFSYLTDDAQFLGRLKTMHGKQEVIAGWSEFFKAAVAPFRWQPERVVTNAAGDLGFSSGPVFDEAVVQTGTFTSTWGKTAGWFVENPLRRRIRLSDDEAIRAVAGILPIIENRKTVNSEARMK
jgi:ketosteroid isomerase-like protein